MGGRGSGGHNGLSDEEKKRRGTFRADQSEEVRNKKAAAKVVAGPWLSSIPEPELPLSPVGRKKYDELTKILFDNNKLTSVTRMWVEQVAILFQEQHLRISTGRSIPASLSDKIQRALAALRVAEDAPAIENPEAKRNRFAAFGFSNKANG